jgi:hypothetical protein
VLAAGDRIPEATVWVEPRRQVPLADLVEDGAALFLFFFFAWSST